MFQELIDNITNVGVFTESLGEWASTLSINKVIIFIMMIFMIVGAIDKIRGNKLGYGEQFERDLMPWVPWRSHGRCCSSSSGACNHFETDHCSDLYPAGR